jgi:hypothetical protein
LADATQGCRDGPSSGGRLMAPSPATRQSRFAFGTPNTPKSRPPVTGKLLTNLRSKSDPAPASGAKSQLQERWFRIDPDGTLDSFAGDDSAFMYSKGHINLTKVTDFTLDSAKNEVWFLLQGKKSTSTREVSPGSCLLAPVDRGSGESCGGRGSFTTRQQQVHDGWYGW